MKVCRAIQAASVQGLSEGYMQRDGRKQGYAMNTSLRRGLSVDANQQKQ
jgi:hypothetical protein